MGVVAGAVPKCRWRALRRLSASGRAGIAAAAYALGMTFGRDHVFDDWSVATRIVGGKATRSAAYHWQRLMRWFLRTVRLPPQSHTLLLPRVPEEAGDPSSASLIRNRAGHAGRGLLFL